MNSNTKLTYQALLNLCSEISELGLVFILQNLKQCLAGCIGSVFGRRSENLG
jgi:hypothetical protein